jgi:hypothetical protein
MSEEQEEGGFSAIKKAVVGAITTGIAAGGAWIAGLFGGGEEQAATPANTPAPAPVVVNVQQSQENTQKQQNNSAPMVIKERVIEKPASTPAPASKPAKDEEDPW